MPYKLLLADDSVTIQRVIELTFAEEDVTVMAVSDGQQAIDLIQAAPPDIVLADVGMPARDGYEVAAFVKDHPGLAHIPVLLLTGAFEPIDEERARAVRCDGVLAKPFEPQMLISRVKELLQKGALSSAELAAVDGVPAAAEPLSAAQALLAAPSADEPAIDEDATVRMARPAAFAEDDLRLDAASLEMSHEPEPVPDATLDEYFDRLDAAFTNLTTAHAGPDAALLPNTPSSEPSGADAPSSLVDDLEAAAAAVAVGVPDAFAALLDAEREFGTGTGHPNDPVLAAGIVLPGTAVTQAFIDEVARRVSERLAEEALRVRVTEIVSTVAERLVREEIERLKAGSRS